jgi:drug/metabolite transporter (DMT)-like permease
MLRNVVLAILVVLAAGFALLGIVVVTRIWSEMADSSDSTYIEGGAICFGIAIIAAAAAVLLRRTGRRVRR